MLSDSQIRDAILWRGLEISGFDPKFLQPASYDVHLHSKLLTLKVNGHPLDPKRDTTGEWETVELKDNEPMTLMPGAFVLASTLERISLGPRLMGQLEGKSSLGRLGLMVHSTAGYLDPGFSGQITLELSCIQPRGIKLYPGMPIGQVAFMSCVAVHGLYAGKYVGQRGPTPSRYHENWNEGGNEWVA